MKKVQVFYAGWGEHWHLGTLADDGRSLLFEYTNEALIQGLEFSPLKLKLRARVIDRSFDSYLPGHEFKKPDRHSPI